MSNKIDRLVIRRALNNVSIWISLYESSGSTRIQMKSLYEMSQTMKAFVFSLLQNPRIMKIQMRLLSKTPGIMRASRKKRIEMLKSNILCLLPRQFGLVTSFRRVSEKAHVRILSFFLASSNSLASSRVVVSMDWVLYFGGSSFRERSIVVGLSGIVSRIVVVLAEVQGVDVFPVEPWMGLISGRRIRRWWGCCGCAMPMLASPPNCPVIPKKNFTIRWILLLDCRLMFWIGVPKIHVGSVVLCMMISG